MRKQFVLILAAGTLIFGNLWVVLLHERPRCDRPTPLMPREQKIRLKLAALGIRPGISPEEMEDATTLLVRERQMWSRFQGFSAQALLQFEDQVGKRVSLTGQLMLRQQAGSAGSDQGMSRPFSMTICDDRGEWKVTTDGTSAGTVTTCKNQDIAETQARIEVPSVYRLLLFPREFLLGLYKGELSPESPLTFDELVESRFRPWLPNNSNTVSHSYIFICRNDSINDPKFEIRDRHFYRWRIGGVWGTRSADATAFYFEDLVATNSFWCPTVFRIQPLPEPWPYPGTSTSLSVVTNVSFGNRPCTNKGMLQVGLSGLSVFAR